MTTKMELTNFLWTLFVILLSLTVYFHYKIFTFWSRRGIPGPLPWPIFGTNIYYILYNKNELDFYWKEKYGRTIGLFEGYSPMLRTTDADVIKQVFIKKFQSITDRNDQFTYQDNLRHWLFFSRGDLWANQRALISPMFSASKMRSMFPIVYASINKFIEQVDKRSKQLSSSIFDKTDLSCLTLDVIASSFFGLQIDTYNSEDAFVRNAYKFADFHLGRFVAWILTPRQLAKLFKFDLFGPDSYKYFYVLAKSVLKQRRALPKDQGRHNMIQALMDAHLRDDSSKTAEKVYSQLDNKEAHYSGTRDYRELADDLEQQTKKATHFRKFSDLEICSQATLMLIAGFETTATTLSFCLFVLANETEIQASILQELYEKFGPKAERLLEDKNDNDNSLADKYSTLLNLKQLDAFISEVLRLYNPVIEQHRSVTDPNGVTLELNDSGQTLHLPCGVPISVNANVVQRDSKYFDRPEEFDMSRFYPENRENIKTGTFLPFSLGPRHCAGMRFALMEIKLALARLLLQYEIQRTKESQYPPKFLQNTFFLQCENSQFRLVPRKGC